MSHESFHAPGLEQLAELLPAYDFTDFIAQGGMGAVYKATQRSLDRAVAIKILPRELGADPEFRRSFETEAKAMARLNHPNLIGVYDYGDIDGMPYIVMEYVNGKSLYHSAWGKVIDPAQAVGIVHAICLGLAHAHEAGIIHRDIKPANILLTPRAEPKIGDFGLANAIDSEGGGLVMGTPGYTAPEFLENHETADHRADIFAVGVILHELVTGERPDATGVPSQTSTGDRNLDAIWHYATHPDPNQRYQSASDMAAALATWTPAPGPRRLVASTAPPAVPRPSPTSSRPIPVHIPKRSSGTLVRNLLIIAGLILAIGLTWKIYQGKVADNARTKQENEQAAREADQANEEAKRKAREAAEEAARVTPGTGTGTVDPAPGDVRPELPPMESLETFRSALREGRRDPMPTGTTRQGSSFWFFVDTPMTWHAAAAFAEDHGGHLPLFDSEDDISWLSQKAPEGSALWLGAGRAGSSRWTLSDGSPWPLEDTPKGVGDYATLDEFGLVRARKASDELPFLIQWQADGSNSATLAAALKHTRETLDGHDPDYPPGTAYYDGRHFAIILRPLARAEAREYAEMAGGTLAIPSTSGEADWLDKECADLPAPHGLWLGGKRAGDLWRWDSGETWQLDRWAAEIDHATERTGLVLLPGKGWSTADPADEASGFVIEWSRDAEGAEAPPEEAGENAAGNEELRRAADLRRTALDYIAEQERDRDGEVQKNAADLGRKLDRWVGRLPGNEAAQWRPHVERLKLILKEKGVPTQAELMDVKGLGLHREMADNCEQSRKAQAQIEANHMANLEKARRSFLGHFEPLATKAEAKGQMAVAATLRTQATNSSDLKGWLRMLRGGSNEEPEQVADGDEAGPPSIVGSWQWHSGEVLQFQTDGTTENKDGQQVAWAPVENQERAFEVTWGNRWIDKLTLSNDGRKLTGENNIGMRIWAIRANPAPEEDPAKDPILGSWNWSNGVVVDFFKDGTAKNNQGLPGTWKLRSVTRDTRYYLIHWKEGNQQWRDVLGLDADHSYLSGTNQDGSLINASRRPADE